MDYIMKILNNTYANDMGSFKDKVIYRKYLHSFALFYKCVFHMCKKYRIYKAVYKYLM